MRKNVITGIGFLVAAAFVIVGSMGVLGEISVWKLLLSFVLIVIFVKSVFRLAWNPMFFSLAILAILYDKPLGIEKLTPWPVLGAAFLGSIGMRMIFGNSRRGIQENDEKQYEVKDGNGTSKINEGEHHFKCDVSFATISKYIKSQSLRKATVVNSFGNVSIYFDEAVLDGGKANVQVTNSFGNVKLYIPSDWEVELWRKTESFGQVKIHKSEGIMNCVIEGGNKLTVIVNTSFGDVDIVYI